MPFFKDKTPKFIHEWCLKQTYQELKELNRRYARFFDRIFTDIEKQESLLVQKKKGIDALFVEISVSEKAFQDFQQHCLENLPSNGAERFLVLNTIKSRTDTKTEKLQDKLRELRVEEQYIDAYISRMKKEVEACVAELKIINSVLFDGRLFKTSHHSAESERNNNAFKM